jgi:carbon monoxide dehydrogenase subunit G
MKLRNEFTVPADVDLAWTVLLDLERVAPCLPGAQLQGGDGRQFSGTMSVKIGPVTNRYQGTVSIEQADHVGHQAIMRAQGNDTHGRGLAAATISTSMRSVSEGTHVTVETDLQISGPAAQFGRGVMQEVASKLIARFAGCLADEMAADAGLAHSLGPARNSAAATRRAATDDAASAGLDWTAAAEAPAPTRPGGYEETPVGRLPTGPAADAALAATAAGTTRRPRSRPTDDVLDLGEISRGAVLKRALPLVALIAALIALALLRRERRRSQ